MAKKYDGVSIPVLSIILIIIGVLVGSVGVYVFLSGKGSASRYADGGGDGDASGGKPRKILYWQAPMDATYIREEPGKSPMGMDLVPVYAAGDTEADMPEPGTVSIDPVMSQNIGVRTERVKRKRLIKELRTVGRVDYDEKRVHHVNTKIEGWVEKLYVDFTGKEVRKDDYLLEIYSPRLVATQEEFLLARSYEEGSEGGGESSRKSVGGSVLELTKRRLSLFDVPAHQIAELEASGRILRTLHIHSPATGVVVNKNVSEGMFVKPGMNLYTIADLSKVWVYADIYEYELSWVSKGQEAEMTLEAYPGRVFTGKVAFINPFMEPKTRTVKVRLEFDNLKGELKPDMFANITLKSVRDFASVAVPSEAVLLSGERSVVVVARGKGKFTPREVLLGVEAGGYYEVLKGVYEGEDVVTSAHFLIDSESRLKEAISKMLEVNVDGKGGGDEDKPGDPTAHKMMNYEAMGNKDMDSIPASVEEKKMDHGMNGKNTGHEMMDHKNMNSSVNKEGDMDHGAMDKGMMDHKKTEHAH